MRRRFLITGATGFLGRRVAAGLIARGDDVTALVRPGSAAPVPSGCSIESADLAGDFSDALARTGRVDTIIHLAQAPGWHAFPEHAAEISAVAVTATTRLAEYACSVGADRFVFASSGGVYGAQDGPISEQAPLRPSSELGYYLAAKSAAEMLLNYFAPPLSLRILRLFFLYGAQQDDRFILPRLVGRIRAGQPITLAQGRGPLINPLHVNDACAAVIAAADAEKSLLANAAGPDVASLADIVEKLATRLDRKAVLEITADAPQDYVADIGVMHEALCTPLIGLDEGIDYLFQAGDR